MELLILILGKKYLEILLIKLFHMITFRIIMLLFSMYKEIQATNAFLFASDKKVFTGFRKSLLLQISINITK